MAQSQKGYYYQKLPLAVREVVVSVRAGVQADGVEVR